jgi:hypothetical protein
MQGTTVTPDYVAETRRWLERAVIGLGLCPFAAAAYDFGRVRFAVSDQSTSDGLRDDLCAELTRLQAGDPRECETTLLIHPRALRDFAEYNDFLGEADATLAALGLEGDVQIASFHPAYRFAGTEADAIENYTNRSPYPLLHLLREASIERALRAWPDPAAIYRRNIRTLQSLGIDGWRRLWLDAGASLDVHSDAEAAAAVARKTHG